MQGYPGLTPFLETQAELMGLTVVPGQRAMGMAKHAKSIQLIESHIGQAARTHTPPARGEILANAEDHLLCIELQLRMGCMMLVDAYQRAEIPTPDWLNRYKPAFAALVDSDPEGDDEAADGDDESVTQGVGDPNGSPASAGAKPRGRRRAAKP